MCGIFGLIANDESALTEKELKLAINRLIKLSEPRGREATGLAISYYNKLRLFKQPRRPSAVMRSAGFNNFIDSFTSLAVSSDTGRLAATVAVIGHTRLVTNGSQAIPENNQPINAGYVIGVHNGIVTNDKELLRLHPELRGSAVSRSDSDTKTLMELINKYYDGQHDMVNAVLKSYEEIKGSASIALLCGDSPIMVLATNTGSLFYSYEKGRGLFVFASERYIIERFFRKNAADGVRKSAVVNALAPFSGILIGIEHIVPEVFSFKTKTERTPQIRKAPKIDPYEITDISQPLKEPRRCAKCVLPETYPFIVFDEHGVCNYCKKYKKQVFLGRGALEEVLQKYRSKDGKPDCVVGFSGGRDSSYGLHILKKEMGMHPIAFTYDWAMVTDFARRNQAKIVGKLGVEHMIRAADIHTKRRYIRKNIYAWLKKPELGMVPIFMAGDKMFYYYGRQLRKETGIKLTIFASGQQLEQMEFKVGFCGIDQDLTNNTKLYNYDFLVKLRLAMWYSWQYCINPAYINESLADSIFAFYSSFINKDDYVYLYRYIPWDEKLIERTLKEEYEWESDEKYGKNQWRMGDGHTAFIDYIYHTVAGFSEFDNFRSNQIREGLLTREEALDLLETDNRPRIEMLQEFSQLIGFNLEEVLLKINAIPKLY